MHRRDWLHAACVATASALGGCTPTQPLRLGTHPWIGHEPLLLAQDFRWLPPEVQVTQARTAPDSLARLREGRLDAATLTLDETLSARTAGVPLTVVLVLDASSGADMLQARRDIATLADLRGKRLAVERSAVGELMLVKILEAARLGAGDLQIVEMRPDEQPAAWQQEGIDAAITYEPTASRLQRLGARRLFDSRALPDTIFDVLAVRRDRMPGRRGAIEAAVAGHFRGLGHLRSNRADATHRIAGRNDMQQAEVMQALAGVTLPDLARNKALLAPSPAMTAATRALAQLMTTKQLIPRPDPLDALFDPSFLPDQEPAG